MLHPGARSAGRGLAACAAAMALVSCGSAEQLPPSPEPAASPPARKAPAGRVVRVGPMPEGIVADGPTGLVAVGLREPPRLALVSARTGRLVRSVALPAAPRHLQLQAPGGPVLVPAEDADALVRVDLPGGRRTIEPVGDFPHDAAAQGGRVFVADERADTVTVLQGGRTIETLPTPTGPGGVAASGDRVAAVAVRAREIELYDARRLRPLGRLNAGVGPTHLVAGHDRLYVIDTQGDALLMFRVRPHLALVCRVNLPGVPYGVAIDRRRDRLWVTLTARNELVELDLKGGREPQPIATYPTVRQPNTVAVDPASGRVFVAGRSNGTLQLLDPPR